MGLKLCSKGLDSQTGVALLMVLWVLTILMVIVFSFSFMVKTDTLSTLSFKGGMERKSDCRGRYRERGYGTFLPEFL